MGFLVKSPKDKLSLIDKNLEVLKYLPLKRQAELLTLSRASLYYQRLPEVSLDDKLVMDKIDVIYTKCPFYGARKIKRELAKQGILVARKKVRKLMRVMGIEAMYQKPNLSLNTAPHPIYPYLLKGLSITESNQVWGIDITYIRLKTGFVYLVAVIDWYSRYVVSWELSISLDKEFVLSCLKKAFLKTTPEILNSDQGVQMTSKDYIDLVLNKGTRISMDHKGRCFDNIFTERFWRTIKYEEVYLKSYESVREATLSLGEYITFYNNERMHQSLNYKTPSEIYFRKEAKKTQSLANFVY